jgi:S1-C subfamily serine protease
MSDLLPNLSEAIAARVAAATPLLASVRGRRGLNAIAWRPDIVVTSEQALPDREGYTLALPGGQEIAATPCGRDPGTNVAILRTAAPLGATGPLAAPGPRVGELVLVLGVSADANPTAQLAAVSEVGAAWHSQAGGRIDALIRLDLRGGRLSEGGLVVDTAGHALGMAAAGPRGQVLVIPYATVARTLDPLVAEGTIARGWLGLGLQPVTLPPALRETVGQDQGRMIVSLASFGPAEQAGLLPGDILLSLDGQPMTGHRAIRAFLGPETVGKAITVKLVRGGLLQTAPLTVAARPAG